MLLKKVSFGFILHYVQTFINSTVIIPCAVGMYIVTWMSLDILPNYLKG